MSARAGHDVTAAHGCWRLLTLLSIFAAVISANQRHYMLNCGDILKGFTFDTLKAQSIENHRMCAHEKVTKYVKVKEFIFAQT